MRLKVTRYILPILLIILFSCKSTISKTELNNVNKLLIGEWAFLRAIDSLLFFITERFKVYLRDNGMRQDLINAVLKRDANDLLSATNRVESLQAFLSTEEGINLLSVCKRSGNILKAEEKKAELPCGDVDTLTHNRAKDLLGALIQARKNIVLEMGNESYSMAMTALSKLRKPIDLFFDEVKVNDEGNNEDNDDNMQ